MNTLLRKPFLTRTRVAAALAVAMLADGLQFLLGPPGWVFASQGIDVVAMMILTLIIGFHPLFLPTFVAEFVPGISMLPTWTGCVLLVMAQRWKQQEPPATPRPPTPPKHSDVIDV